MRSKLRIRGRKADYIIVDDPYCPAPDSVRAEHQELLRKWYNSKWDQCIMENLL